MNKHRRPATASDRLMARLKTLHDTNRLTFREIAATGEFGDAPHSAIYTIYKTGSVPGRWRGCFRAYEACHPAPARVAVHKTNMRSAARTLRCQLTPAALAELTDLLLAGQIK